MSDEPARLLTVAPGALTALLGELARAPERSGWTAPPVPGETIGRFEIVREIGRGAFGVVYEARDTELGRSVAFKAIRAGSSAAAREQRALAEAEAAARLAHPNIVHLYDLGRCERGAFLIMELLHGESLAERLARGPFQLRNAVNVATEIARGLAHAHDQGVVHRDLKPGNVFLCDDGQVKVLDFGLAHVFGRGGASGGTPAYMAPEQARGEPSDERADVYALGVIVHELVTGKRPFEDGERGIPDGGKAPEMPGAPAALAKRVGRMLARDPAARPASGGEVHADLAAIGKSLERRRARIAWAVAAGTLAAALFLAFRPRPPPLPPGRLLVAIADAANASGERDLDGTSQLLGAALEQSRRVSILARSRLLGLLRGPDGVRPSSLEEARVREAARRAAAHVVIIPAVRRAGDDYDPEARAVDLARDEPFFTVRERAGGKGAFPDALDRLAAGIRAGLREQPQDAPAGGPRLAQIVPSSPEAWRRYADGQRLDSEGSRDEAERAYEDALTADSEFPLAHLRLAEILFVADPRAVKAHLAAALRGVDRLPPKDRELLEARRAFLELRLADALVHYDHVIAGWPQDPAGHVGAADLTRLYGGAELARPYIEKAIELQGVDEMHAIDFLVELGKVDEALARAQAWASRSPGPITLRELSYVLGARGDATAALDARRRAMSFDPPPLRPRWSDPWFFLEAGAEEEAEALYRASGGPPWSWLAVRGRRHAALAAYDAQAPPPSSPARGSYHLARTDLTLGDGDPDRLWRDVVAALELGHFGANCARASLAYLGDLDRAARLDALWPGDDPRGYCARGYLLVKAWKTGDRETALRGFDDMYAGMTKYFRGEVLQELGRDRDAVAAFRLFRRWQPAWGSTEAATWMYPRSLLLESTSLERLGEREEALRVVDRLLRLWKDADPDLPTLREAKALRASLSGPAPP